jgi:AcrR family transcriptional regulator
VAAVAALSPKVRQRRKDARPQELLEAAMTLFVEKGFAATRAEEVAQRAGVSKGTLYLYFPSKNDLFKAVVRAYLIQFIAEGQELVDQFTGSASALLHSLAHAWWTRIGGSQVSGLVGLIIAEAQNFPELAQFYMDEVVAPSHALLARVVQRGMDAGEFRRMDVNSVVHALMATAQFLVLHRQCASACTVVPAPLDPAQFIPTQIELLLRGLEVRPSPSAHLST